MAKQRISIIETHLEKVVLAVTVVILGAVALLYLVQTPNLIEEAGRKYGSGDYDKEVVRAKADTLAGTFNRAPDQPAAIPDLLREFKRLQNQPLASVEAHRQWPAFQPWRPNVPPALGIKPTTPGQILLARVPPPAKPVAYAGLTTVEIEPPRPLDAPELSGAERDEMEALIREKDHSWVTVAAVVDLEAQRNEFRRARYDSELQDITLCRVRAQQQRLLPGGRWSDWRDLQPWTPYAPVLLPEVELAASGDGFILPQRQGQVLKQFLGLAWNYALELKMPLPPYSAAGDLWRLPPLPEVDWCSLDLDWLQMEPNEENCNPYLANLPEPALVTDTGEPSGSLSPAQVRRMERLQAAEDYKRAVELSKNRKQLPDLLEAERLIKRIKANKHASKRLRDKADRLLAEILPDIEELEAQQRGVEPEEPQDQPQVPELEQLQQKTVVWVHDMPVEPGHAYRYRLAVDLYNHYLGQYDKLLDTEAASRVLLQGEWSQPSKPVEVKPEVAFFVTTADAREAKIDIFKWFRGKIANRKIRLAPGQRVTLRDFVRIPGEKGRFAVDFDTGYTLLAIEEARPTLVRETIGREGAFRYREETTPLILCVDEKGRLLVRSKTGDQAEQREWSALFKKFKTE